MRKTNEILCCVVMLCYALGACSDKQATIKVSGFGIWLNTLGGKLPPSQTAKVIEASQTGIAGIQEGHIYEEDGVRHDHIPEIAEPLGFHLFNQREGHYILSRYPTIDGTASHYGMKIQADKDEFYWMFNCHLYYIPYQPYQLDGIPYGDCPFIDTEEEAIRLANEAWREEITRYQKDVQQIMKEGYPVFLTRDFSEPSFLGWTQRTTDADIHKIKVGWPTIKTFSRIGMNDSYQIIHPDEVSTPDCTWTPVPSEQEIPSRLDFVLYSRCEVANSFIIGESETTSDVVVSPYPSDRRVVASYFNF